MPTRLYAFNLRLWLTQPETLELVSISYLMAFHANRVQRLPLAKRVREHGLDHVDLRNLLDIAPTTRVFARV